jgi:hypothetical protein
MANHTSTRTTRLYDRRSDQATLDDVERIRLGSLIVFGSGSAATSGMCS